MHLSVSLGKMKQKKTIQWHPALIAGLKVEFEAYKDILTIESEYSLNENPRRLDALIIKKSDNSPIASPIAASFLRYNVIDYKSPGKSMNITNFYKVLSYAYSLPDLFHSDAILNEITITLVSHSFPVKLVRHIRDRILHQTESPLEKVIPGLYHINMKGHFLFPIQIVVLPELPSEEYLWLHCLGKRLDADWPLSKLGREYAKHKNEEPYQTIMNAIIRANLTVKEDVDIMCEALYELFADELIKYKNDGIRIGREAGIQIGEKNGRKAGEAYGMQIGEKIGEKRGILIGEKNGENLLSDLLLKLISDNRNAEIERVAADPEYRAALMKQYHLK